MQWRVIGRLGGDAPPEESWEGILALHELLGPIEGEERLTLIRAIWDALLSMPRRALGPRTGEHLSLLITASDSEGDALSAVGFSHIWAVTRGEGGEAILEEIVAPGNPEVGPAGVPRIHPKALSLPSPAPLYLAAVEEGGAPDSDELERLLTGAEETFNG